MARSIFGKNDYCPQVYLSSRFDRADAKLAMENFIQIHLVLVKENSELIQNLDVGSDFRVECT